VSRGALYDDGGVISGDDARARKSPAGGFRRGFHRDGGDVVVVSGDANLFMALTPESGHGLSGELDPSGRVVHLEVHGADMPDRGVAPAPVVTVLDVSCRTLCPAA
jgi:hypothetical protein